MVHKTAMTVIFLHKMWSITKNDDFKPKSRVFLVDHKEELPSSTQQERHFTVSPCFYPRVYLVINTTMTPYKVYISGSWYWSVDQRITGKKRTTWKNTRYVQFNKEVHLQGGKFYICIYTGPRSDSPRGKSYHAIVN